MVRTRSGKRTRRSPGRVEGSDDLLDDVHTSDGPQEDKGDVLKSEKDGTDGEGPKAMNETASETLKPPGEVPSKAIDASEALGDIHPSSQSDIGCDRDDNHLGSAESGGEILKSASSDERDSSSLPARADDTGSDVDRSTSDSDVDGKHGTEENPFSPSQSDQTALAVFDMDLAMPPEMLLSRSKEVSDSFRKVIRDVFEAQSNFDAGHPHASASKNRRARGKWVLPLGPLLEIDVRDIFETEQVWEEVALRNSPLLSYLEKSTHRMQLQESKRREKVSKVPAVGKESRKTGDEFVEESVDPGTFIKSNGADALDGAALETDSIVSDGSLKTDNHDEENFARKEEFADVVGAGLNREKGKKRVRFNIDSSDAHASNHGLTALAQPDTPSKLEDGFFCLADMEAFAGEAEGLAMEGRLMASDDEDSSNAGSEGDSEVQTGFGERGTDKSGMPQTNDMTRKNGERVRYEDFFDFPVEGQLTEGESSKNDRRRRLLSSVSEGSDLVETPLEKQRKALRSDIDLLEDVNVAKKPWQLQGEVQAHSRPVNSLLESDFEHDVVSRASSLPISEMSASIEDIVKQRVFDGLFDDVARKLPADYEDAKADSGSRTVLPDVSQEKPEEGLADIYEKEFAAEREKISKAAEASSGIARREDDPKDSPEQAEVNRLFTRLSNKLDALASLHFTPTAAKIPTEMEVKPNVPAFSAEEAIPEAVSDAALLAPREIHAPDAELLEGTADKNKEDRRRERRSRKRRISAANKQVEAESREKQRNDPELAASKRAERTLQRPGKLLKHVKTPGSKRIKRQGSVRMEPGGSSAAHLTKSSQYFARLQETVKSEMVVKRKESSVSEGSHTRSVQLKM